MTETYKVIADLPELEKFVAWLPVLKPDEVFYVTLLARSKYVDGVVGWTTNSDRKQCARFLTTTDRLIEKLKKTEIVVGHYTTKGVEIPQAALAAYITPNPRSLTLGMRNAAHKFMDYLLDGQVKDAVEESMTEVHKARGSKYYVDFDFDGDETKPEDLLQHVNPEALTIVHTRGGFHALVNPLFVHKFFMKTWYQAIQKLPGVDHTGDKMLPIPGCVQGGFVPRLSKLQSIA